MTLTVNYFAFSVFFIGSVPGYHSGENREKYGHIKCRNLIRKHSTWGPRITNPIIAQCSSIGNFCLFFLANLKIN